MLLAKLLLVKSAAGPSASGLRCFRLVAAKVAASAHSPQPGNRGPLPGYQLLASSLLSRSHFQHLPILESWVPTLHHNAASLLVLAEHLSSGLVGRIGQNQSLGACLMILDCLQLLILIKPFHSLRRYNINLLPLQQV